MCASDVCVHAVIKTSRPDESSIEFNRIYCLSLRFSEHVCNHLSLSQTFSKLTKGTRMYDVADFIVHLPQMRRHARALTGSQEAGDQLVVAVLDRLGSVPSESHRPAKIAMFQILADVWLGCFSEQFEKVNEMTVVGQQLDAIDQRTRQACLLIALDQFSNEEAAEILRCDVEKLEIELRAARSAVAGHISTNVLIIEDEFLIAAHLEQIILSMGHQIVAKAATQKNAVQAAKNKPVGLILADIKLADGSNGIDAVNELLETFSIPVIFITAYPDALLSGLRPEPTFMVAKPFSAEEVQAVVSQALFFKQNASAQLEVVEKTRRLVADIKP